MPTTPVRVRARGSYITAKGLILHHRYREQFEGAPRSEYGRYDGPSGLVRNAGPNNESTPPLQRDATGQITEESMNNLLQTLSNASGKCGQTDALLIETTDDEDQLMESYLEGRQAQNKDPNRQKYPRQFAARARPCVRRRAILRGARPQATAFL